MSDELRSAIIDEAKRLGVDPLDFANIISYETGGTFDPWQKGPTTQWGRHVGLIQMGEPQRKKYGYTPDKSVTDLVRATGAYFQDNGLKPGMGLLDMYSIVNTGAPGKYNLTDENNGGAPGTVAEKVNEMRGAHRTKAAALLGGEYQASASSAPVYTMEQGAPQTINPYNQPKMVDTSYVYENRPAQPTTWQDDYVRQSIDVANENDGPSFYEGMKAAVSNNWSLAWAMSASPYSGEDPNFVGKARQDAFLNYSKDLPDDLAESLLYAKSDAEMQYLRQQALNTMKNEETLQQLGWTGVGLSIGAAVLDPVAIGVSVLSDGALAPILAARKVGTVGRVVSGALAAGASNAAAEAAVGIWNPQVTKQSIAEAGALGMFLGGAFGAIGRNPKLAAEAERMIRYGEAHGGSTAGAAQVAGRMEQTVIGSLVDDVMPGDVSPVKFEKGRFDLSALLSASGDDATRLLGRHLVQEAVGVKGEDAIEVAASVRKETLRKSSVYNTLADVVPSYKKWAERTGVRQNEDTWNAFNEQITKVMDNKDPTAHFDPEAKAAATAYDRFYDRFWALANNPGAEMGDVMEPIPGFAQLKDRYRPMYSDIVNIHKLRQLVGEDNLIKLVKNAIAKRTEDIDDALLARMAKGYVQRIERVGMGGNAGFDDIFQRGERAEILDYIHNDLNLSAEDAEKITEKIMKAKTRVEGDKTPTSRGKRRTPIDYTHSEDFIINGQKHTVSVRDFFMKDAHMIMTRYADEMSGHIALAQMVVKNPKTGQVIINGIRTKADWQRIINQIGERYATGKAAGGPKAAQAAINRLQYVYDHLTGKPRMGNQAGESWVAWTRRMGKLQFLRLMQNMGIPQAQELVNIPSSVGLKAFFQGVPAFGRMLKEFSHEGADGTKTAFLRSARKDEVVQELMSATGEGSDAFLNAFKYRHLDDAYGEVFGESKLDKAGLVFDKFASKGQRVIANVSLMKHTNTILHQWAMRAIAQKVANLAFKHADKLEAVEESVTRKGQKIDMATGKSYTVDEVVKVKKPHSFKMTDLNTVFGWKNAERMRLLGWDEDKVAGIMKEMLTHADGAAKGERLTKLNLDQWDPKVRSDFIEGMDQWVGRVIQRNDIGNLSKWMTHPVAQIMGQFRTFVFGAYAKQTLYGLAHLDPKTFANLTLQIAAGAGTWYLVNKIRSLGEKDPEQFMEDKTAWDEMVKAGVSRAGITSILPMFIDQGARIATGSPVFDYRTSGTPSSGVFSVPALNHFDDISMGVTSVVDALRDGRNLSQNEWKRIMRATIGNHIALTTGLSYLVQDLPKNAPKNDK